MPFVRGLFAFVANSGSTNMIPSLIRTYVPLAVSFLVGWLASLGIDLSGEQQTALTGIIGTVVAAVYYALVRLLEKKFPALSVLLGSSKQPRYAPKSADGKAHVVTSAPIAGAQFSVSSEPGTVSITSSGLKISGPHRAVFVDDKGATFTGTVTVQPPAKPAD